MRLWEERALLAGKWHKQRHRGENVNEYELVKWREMKCQSFHGRPSVLS